MAPGEPGLAEARGFEPPVPVKGQLISSESHSAALARLLDAFLRGRRSFRTAGDKGYTAADQDAKRLVSGMKWGSAQVTVEPVEDSGLGVDDRVVVEGVAIEAGMVGAVV